MRVSDNSANQVQDEDLKPALWQGRESKLSNSNMDAIKETKNFCLLLKQIPADSDSWSLALNVLDKATKPVCIDYFVYLDGLFPVIHKLKSTQQDPLTLMRLLDFLLKVTSGKHIFSDQHQIDALCNGVEHLKSHSHKAVGEATSTILKILQKGETCHDHKVVPPSFEDIEGAVSKAMSSNVTATKDLCGQVQEELGITSDRMLEYKPLVDQLIRQHLDETPLRSIRSEYPVCSHPSYNSNVCGRWAYILSPDFGESQCRSDGSEPTARSFAGNKWLFCKIVGLVHGPPVQHVVEVTCASDVAPIEVGLQPENTRFLTDKEAQEIMRRTNKSSKKRRGRENISPQAQTKERIRHGSAPSQLGDGIRTNPKTLNKTPSAKVVTSDEAISSKEVPSPVTGNSVVSGEEKQRPCASEKERLEALDGIIVKMRMRQWHEAQRPFSRRRKNAIRQSYPVYLRRNLHKEPCLKFIEGQELGKLPDRISRESTSSMAVLKYKLSNYPGVSWSLEEYAWRGSTSHENDHCHLGYFESEQDAWRAVYTLREARGWPEVGPPPLPLPEGDVHFPEVNSEKDQRSIYPGVKWIADRSVWQAETRHKGVVVSLGNFLSKERAWETLCLKRKELRWPAKSVQAKRKKQKRRRDRDTKSRNDIEKRQKKPNRTKVKEPRLRKGIKMYVSWDMFQKLTEKTATPEDWNAYNLKLSERSGSCADTLTNQPMETEIPKLDSEGRTKYPPRSDHKPYANSSDDSKKSQTISEVEDTVEKASGNVKSTSKAHRPPLAPLGPKEILLDASVKSLQENKRKFKADRVLSQKSDVDLGMQVEQPKKEATAQEASSNKKMKTEHKNGGKNKIDKDLEAQVEKPKKEATPQEAGMNKKMKKEQTNEVEQASRITAKTAEPKRIFKLQGQWLSVYEGVRTDPVVTGEEVAFRNGFKYQLQNVRGRLTIDGIWALDNEVSTSDMCIWRNTRRRRSSPVVWTRKEMPSRKAKQQLSRNAKLDAPNGVVKRTDRGKYVDGTPLAPARKRHAEVNDNSLDFAIDRSEVKKPRTKLQHQLDRSEVKKPNIKLQSQLDKQNRQEIKNRKGKQIQKEEFLKQEKHQQEKVQSERGNDADLFAVARLLAGFQGAKPANHDALTPPYSRQTQSEILNSKFINFQSEDTSSWKGELQGVREQSEMEFVEDYHEGSTSGGEDEFELERGSSEAFEHLMTSVINLGDENMPEEEEREEERSPLKSDQSVERKGNMHGCLACGAQLEVRDGQETVECDACGSTSMTYRYKHCTSAVDTLIQTAEKQFKIYGGSSRGWNRHGHREWVGE
mmetsp:Transcript_16024/g.39500  ORF Transcript_16024/g.39500 Transcript_16024/m.39500 type:complete len:1310 (-) Transcript_16024:329-4258(-)